MKQTGKRFYSQSQRIPVEIEVWVTGQTTKQTQPNQRKVGFHVTQYQKVDGTD